MFSRLRLQRSAREKAIRFLADADLRFALNDAPGKNGASDRKVDPLLGLMP
jgi:hypothetical protein